MKKKSQLSRFAAYYKPHLHLFIIDMTCALIIAAVDVVYPLYSKIALEQYLPNGQFQAFFAVVIAFFIAHAARAVLEYVVTAIGHYLGVLMEADMRRDLFSHLQKLSFRFYDKSRTGVLMARVTHDLFEITELAHHGPEDVFISVLTFLGAFVVMLTIEWRLALVLMVSVPVMIVVTIMLRKRMNDASRKVKEGLAGVNASIESSISGMRVAKAFNNEEYEIDKFNTGNGIYVRSRRRYYTVMGQFMASLEFFTSILKVVVLGVGGYMIMKNRMDMTALLIFTMYVASFTSPIRKLAMFAETYVMGMTGFRRFEELMDTEPEIEDAPGANPLKDVRGGIEFDHVSFAYDQDQTVLRDVSLTITPGHTVALVGPSGGGKTTISHLLPRFYDPSAGAVRIDGQDLKRVTMRSVRENIGIVQQDVFLFADTVRENIRYGRTDATDEEIVAAAKAAEIHDDIMAMPDGYDTVVGERGATLSGGQKQRVSIARIFLKNPPILILDEATSALDSVTEARITASLERLSAGRTTIVIAHRLSTIRNADEIIVIDDGIIKERGTHDALVAQNGEYARLHTAQAGN
ncbi:MAG: ABC transporter ATP-binding protein [Clostridiaceae bacterium]|nr:ABC transporter ATP-binding protein/permease [Eubacteriales bacterium]